MDDFRLRVFIAAAKSLSFTRCAEQLYISQPAVSKHIGELESRYKAQLFERHGSRLVLTDAGRTLLAYAERITDEYRKLQYEMSLKTDREGGRLRLGASSTIAQYLLPRVLARFTVRFPDVRVSLISGNSQQIEQALARHDIDLGLVESASHHQGLHYMKFVPDELVLVADAAGAYGRCEEGPSTNCAGCRSYCASKGRERSRSLPATLPTGASGSPRCGWSCNWAAQKASSHSSSTAIR